jgi:hypothetical protein
VKHDPETKQTTVVGATSVEVTTQEQARAFFSFLFL